MMRGEEITPKIDGLMAEEDECIAPQRPRAFELCCVAKTRIERTKGLERGFRYAAIKKMSHTVRISICRLLVISVVLFLITAPAQAKGKYASKGCSIIVGDDINGTPLAGNLRNPIDEALLMDGAELSELFQVSPALFYMQEDDEPNALAAWVTFPDLLRQEGRNASCCPDGTVLIGLKLLDYEWRATRGTGLSIPAIEAHEYAHIAQFKYGFPWAGKWRELHADYLAGWYIAHRHRFLVTSPDQAMANFFYKGDYEFNDPEHHGTPEERADVFRAGFDFNRLSNIASGSLAFQAGIDYLKACRRMR